MRHNVCCVSIENHYVDFDQPQTRHYEQRNKRSWETISIAENERKKIFEIGKAFQTKWLNRSQTIKISRQQWYTATTN